MHAQRISLRMSSRIPRDRGHHDPFPTRMERRAVIPLTVPDIGDVG